MTVVLQGDEIGSIEKFGSNNIIIGAEAMIFITPTQQNDALKPLILRHLKKVCI